jgi:hypothetical protein
MRIGIAAIVVALCAGAGAAQTPTVLPLPTIASAPVLDGDLSDPCWKDALKTTEFVRFGGASPVREATEAWIATDGQQLYVAFYCHDSQAALIRTSETQRSSQAVLSDDSVRIYIDSQNTRREVSTFAVNARGTQYDKIEGGTPLNITWVGDWRAATRRVDDGWTCEIAIPFRLLRYRDGARAIGLQLGRLIARESNALVWPATPPAGQTSETRAQFLTGFSLAQPLPPFVARPVSLPYVLGTVGNGGRGRAGVDVKLPFSTTMTGVLAIRPDFLTIENDVAALNFSYNEQLVGDSRPFFAEGAQFLPETDLFYSRRISDVDEGIKVAGRSENTSIGFLATNYADSERGRSNAVLNVQQGFGALSRIAVSAIGDNRNGLPENRVARLFGEYGWLVGPRQVFASARRTETWRGGRQSGAEERLRVRVPGLPGKPRADLLVETVDNDFVSDLGLVQDRNRRGGQLTIGQRNLFDRGLVEQYNTELVIARYNRQTGGFFRDEQTLRTFAQNRRGYGIQVIGTNQRRRQSLTENAPTFHDRYASLGFVWNQRNLFNNGSFLYNTGRLAGQGYRLVGADQVVPLSVRLSLMGTFLRQTLGPETTRQAIVTGTYRLDPFRAISGRLVSQTGTGNAANVGPTRGTNLYVGYAQRSRRGTDIFVILGDPNAENTRTQVTVKVARPF